MVGESIAGSKCWRMVTWHRSLTAQGRIRVTREEDESKYLKPEALEKESSRTP